MRCPKCNQEINPHSERCPNCGTSSVYAIPDGDTITRVRRQISEIRRENEVSDVDLSDASFSPVLKFDKPVNTHPQEKIEGNPADNFPDQIYTPVDISEMIEQDSDLSYSHRDLSSSIRHMINNKEDDLLAEYYFKDGISDLESYRLAQSYAQLEKGEGHPEEEKSDKQSEENDEMSDAARRLSNFPEEKGLDRFLTSMWERYDALTLKIKGFLRKNVLDRLKKLYDLFDSKTAGFMNGLLRRFYFRRFGSLKRAPSESEKEAYQLRRKTWCFVVGFIAFLFCVIIIVNMLMTTNLNGEWIVSTDAGGSPNIVMQFKPGGKACISVKSDDGWHIHKQGKYSTMRKNGHDMLTITYEDGDVKQLYYIIEGDTGTFINVDTNVQVEYERK